MEGISGDVWVGGIYTLLNINMKRADIKVWFACNNHCDFCVQWDKRERYKSRTFWEIQKILEEEYQNGCKGVVFTGGEPTLHPKLIESVSYAKSLGYKEVQIQSNGRNFSDREYVKELIGAGVTEFSPSIHGFHPETHDSLVGSPWAWKQVIDGIRNLKKLGQRIIINSVIVEQNFRETPKLASLLVQLWVQQYQFAFVHILWSADKNKTKIVPRKSEIMPYIKKSLDIGKNAWVICMTEAIPFCFLQWYEWAIAEYNFMPETTVVDAEYRTDNYTDYRWNEWKAKREECKKCIHYKICEWPWKEYPEMYWWNEFTPVRKNNDTEGQI